MERSNKDTEIFAEIFNRNMKGKNGIPCLAEEIITDKGERSRKKTFHSEKIDLDNYMLLLLK